MKFVAQALWAWCTMFKTHMINSPLRRLEHAELAVAAEDSWHALFFDAEHSYCYGYCTDLTFALRHVQARSADETDTLKGPSPTGPLTV